ALEYTVKPQPQRFLGYAREGLARANGVLVGSRHTADSLWALMDDAQLQHRTRLGPPGVDVARFGPAPPERAAADLRALAAALAARDLERARALAERGRALETRAGEPQPLRYLASFFDGLRGRRREAYLDSAPALAQQVVFTGRLEHEELARLLPACEAVVVP